MNLSFKAICMCLFFATMTWARQGIAQESRGDGQGVDSQLLWATPGPSNFATVQSSDIVEHLGVAFGVLIDHYRKPLGIEQSINGKTNEHWVVRYATTTDFMWAFGVLDILQIGMVLPVVVDQAGVGATSFMPLGADDSKFKLAGSALRDLRIHAKSRFLGGDAEIPDRRDFGLALDVGISLPTGDELNFAGDNGLVFAPNVIFDFHRCKLSAAINLGARFRTERGILADLDVDHQGTAGFGITGHYLDHTLLLSLEGTAVVEFDGFDRFSFEYRGSIGYVPDKAKTLTIWLSGGSSLGTGDLLGTPLARLLLGLTYTPGSE